MQLISPITEDSIRPYIGKPVCAVMHNGTYMYGTISDCRGGQLYFQGGGPSVLSTSNKRARGRIKENLKNKAKVSFYPYSNPGYGGYGYGGYGFGSGAGIAAVSLALIAALFLFPFFI